MNCIAKAIYVRSATTKPDGHPTIRVQPEAGASWVVYVGHEQSPVSQHANETDAERFAIAYAQRLGCDQIEIKDAYHRLHPVRCGAGGPAAPSP